MTTTNQTKITHDADTAIGTKIPFDSINEPGCYICNWSGHLMRVPDDGVAPGRSPVINIIGGDQLFVTKLSDNPYCSITKAKMIAANLDCNVNF
jgi:hypothetical protein